MSSFCLYPCALVNAHLPQPRAIAGCFGFEIPSTSPFYHKSIRLQHHLLHCLLPSPSEYPLGQGPDYTINLFPLLSFCLGASVPLAACF